MCRETFRPLGRSHFYKAGQGFERREEFRDPSSLVLRTYLENCDNLYVVEVLLDFAVFGLKPAIRRFPRNLLVCGDFTEK